ncbi:CarD family transcriptional regulator [Kineothrix alysoides]|uniref:CarD family transcriptional regulator n=1 Tax=Kineothrix alysoides TaxID=1469948 RepID=A0A4R1R3F6_9FIRM|nr:CarD family transcriptional regulator [Kineothrix alysoides]TCL59929.1 CarD family transcriptional regulator [Kineothrix alysoides]
MFKIGDYVVVNANYGLCKIEDIACLDISMAIKGELYYLMIPLEEIDAKLYIPVNGTKHKIRKVINEEEAWEIIGEVPEIEEMLIDSSRLCEKKYKEAIQSCEPRILISIIKSMYYRRRKRDAQGKKNTVIDERYFKIAENKLYEELAFALGKNKNEMQKLIMNRIKKNK